MELKKAILLNIKELRPLNHVFIPFKFCLLSPPLSIIASTGYRDKLKNVTLERKMKSTSILKKFSQMAIPLPLPTTDS
jgi:hypothetical protein